MIPSGHLAGHPGLGVVKIEVLGWSQGSTKFSVNDLIDLIEFNKQIIRISTVQTIQTALVKYHFAENTLELNVNWDSQAESHCTKKDLWVR